MRIILLTFGCVPIVLASVVAAAGSDSALVGAVKSGDVKAVRAALQQGAAVSAAESDGSTALHEAVRRENLDMVDLLLAARADVKAANRYNITPLSLACANGNAA